MEDEENDEAPPTSFDTGGITVVAARRDTRRECTLQFLSAMVMPWSEVESQLVTAMKVEKGNALFTYSIHPEFLTQPNAFKFRSFGLAVETDWKAAIVTGISMPDRCVYVLVEEINPYTDIIRSLRKYSSRAEVDGVAVRNAREKKRQQSSDWDFLDTDITGVRQLWKMLPSVNLMPFSSLLLWNKSELRKRESSWLSAVTGNIPLQEFEWRTYLDSKRRLVREPELRIRVFYGGVREDLRPVVWRHLLYVFPPKLTWTERYEYLGEQRAAYLRLRDEWHTKVNDLPPESQSVLTSVRHDVIRTDRDRSFFAEAGSDNQERLFKVLATYALNHPDMSYVQGMNEIAAIFLEIYSGDQEHCEADTYICLKAYLDIAPMLFEAKGLALKFNHFQALLHRYDSTLYEHLEKSGCNSMVFCCPWILINFKREFVHADVLLLWEAMWSTLSPPQGYLTALAQRKMSAPVDMHDGDTVNDTEHLEHAAREVEGAWVRASQIEEGLPAEMLMAQEAEPVNAEAAEEEADIFQLSPFNLAIPDKDSIQRCYGNILVLFIAIAVMTKHRDVMLPITPSEEGLAVYFSQQKGLHNAQQLLDSARRMMVDYVTRNDDNAFLASGD